jgi:hypothetical protein
MPAWLNERALNVVSREFVYHEDRETTKTNHEDTKVKQKIRRSGDLKIKDIP